MNPTETLRAHVTGKIESGKAAAIVEVRPLHVIAADIRRLWGNVNYAAAPYLDAMGSLNAISDNYYQDTAASVVRYFLSNATSWRGDDARRIKAELKAMLPR